MVMRLYATFGSTDFQKAYQTVANIEFEDFADYRKKYVADLEVRAATYSVVIARALKKEGPVLNLRKSILT